MQSSYTEFRIVALILIKDAADEFSAKNLIRYVFSKGPLQSYVVNESSGSIHIQWFTGIHDYVVDDLKSVPYTL